MLWKSVAALSTLAVTALGFKNPLKDFNGSDPQMQYWGGNYYLLTTTWTHIAITTSPTLEGLKTAEPKIVHSSDDPSRCCNLWAPEMHYIDGNWRIYYTAGTNGTFDNQFTHVLKGGQNPLDTYEYEDRVVMTGRDVWAIDSTILQMDYGNFLIYSSWDPNTPPPPGKADDRDQCLYIANMTSPTTVGRSVKISAPTYDWETVGTRVNEGAYPLYHDGRTFLSYSAAGCAGGEYKLGLLELIDGNPMSPCSWKKYPEPVFSAKNGTYAPGHNANFYSPDGKETWNVYHANKDVAGSLLCDGARDTRAQIITWGEDGLPNYGEPLPLDVEISPPSGEASARGYQV